MRSNDIEMVIGGIPRSLLLCSFSLMKKNEKIKTQKSFHARGRMAGPLLRRPTAPDMTGSLSSQ